MSSDTDNAILEFYRGGKDAEGRTLTEILAWDDEKLEDVHDYIQWIFPTAKASEFNRRAPVLDSATISAFKAEPELRTKLLDAFARMLRFYGFELEQRDGRPAVVRGVNWSTRREEWLTPGNHNLLRITRILDCLATLALEEHARAFLATLEGLDENDRRKIGRRTYAFWREAAKG